MGALELRDGALHGRLDDPMRLIYGVKDVRQAGVVRVHESVLAQVEREVVHVWHVERDLSNACHGGQNRRSHVVTCVLDRRARHTLVRGPCELFHQDVHDLSAALHEGGTGGRIVLPLSVHARAQKPAVQVEPGMGSAYMLKDNTSCTINIVDKMLVF